VPADHAFFTEAMRARQAELLRGVSREDACSLDAFRSLMKVSNLVSAVAEKRLDRQHLSMSKMRLLLLLRLRENEGMLPSELSKLQGVMPNTISSLLASMNQAGWIERVTHPADRRKRIIRITNMGKRVLDEVVPTHRDLLHELFGNFSEDDKLTLTTLLDKLIDNVQAVMTAEEEAQKQDGS
jgi:MarR family 2-MHQ and catechol resistance regulon transcriptional repressor